MCLLIRTEWKMHRIRCQGLGSYSVCDPGGSSSPRSQSPQIEERLTGEMAQPPPLHSTCQDFPGTKGQEA